MFCVVIREVGLLRYLWNLFLLVSLVSFASSALGIVRSIMGSGGGELSAMGSARGFGTEEIRNEAFPPIR